MLELGHNRTAQLANLLLDWARLLSGFSRADNGKRATNLCLLPNDVFQIFKELFSLGRDRIIGRFDLARMAIFVIEFSTKVRG